MRSGCFKGDASAGGEFGNDASRGARCSKLAYGGGEGKLRKGARKGHRKWTYAVPVLHLQLASWPDTARPFKKKSK